MLRSEAGERGKTFVIDLEPKDPKGQKISIESPFGGTKHSGIGGG